MPANNHMKRLVLVALLGLPAATMATEVYRWVDNQGIVHYGSVAPHGVNAERVSPGRPLRAAPSLAHPNRRSEAAAPAAPQDDAANSLPADDDLGLTEEEQQLRAELDAEAQQRRASLDEERRAMCQAARRHYDELTTHSRVRVRGADGQARTLSEEELRQRIAEARDAIVTNCD